MDGFVIFVRGHIQFLVLSYLVSFSGPPVRVARFFLLHPGFGRFRAISRAFAVWVAQLIIRAVKVS